MTSMTSEQPGGVNQTTDWVYGVTTASGSAINSNDVVGTTEYPDPTTGAASTSQETKLTVDAQGNGLTSTDRNGTTHTFSYDALGRQIADTVTALGSGVDGSVMKITTAYDGQGNPYLVTSYDGTGNILNQVEDLYNGFGQLIQEYQSASGAVNTSTTPSVQYTYSDGASGNNSLLTGIIYPDGYTLTYNYASGVDSAVGRATSISDSTGTLQSFTYQGVDTVVGTSDQAGVNEAITLDQFGRVSEMKYSTSSATLVDYQYGYDDDGNVLFKKDLVNSSLSQLFRYDNLGELTSFQEGTLNSDNTAISGTPSQSQSWSFDALGNWNSVTTNSSTQTRTANAQNEYTSVSGATTPTYDANGNMTTDSSGLKYVYNAWNQPVAVENSSGTTLETYEYNGLGQRIATTIAATSTTTTLYYSADSQVLEEWSGGDWTNRYVWDPVYVNALVLRDSMVQVGPALRVWALQDANWNVVSLVGASGSVVERYDYTPFGQVTIMNGLGTVISSSAYGWQYLFQGGRQDVVTGDYNFQNRDYDPVLGRWMSTDPLGFAGGSSNLYAVEGNDPVGYVDPHGLEDAVNPAGFWSRTGNSFDWIFGETSSKRRQLEAERYRLLNQPDKNGIFPGPLTSGSSGTAAAFQPAADLSLDVIKAAARGAASGLPYAGGILAVEDIYNAMTSGKITLKEATDLINVVRAAGKLKRGGKLLCGGGAQAPNSGRPITPGTGSAPIIKPGPNSPVPGPPQVQAPTTQSILTGAAGRANTTVGAGRGPAHGTRVHSAFEAEVNALRNGNLTTEVSYLNGRVVPRGTRGSVRLDVVEGPLTAPTAIYDLKTGSATLTPARIQQIQQHIPGGANVPVIEIR